MGDAEVGSLSRPVKISWEAGETISNGKVGKEGKIQNVFYGSELLWCVSSVKHKRYFCGCEDSMETERKERHVKIALL